MNERYIFRGKSLHDVPAIDIESGDFVYGAFYDKPILKHNMPSTPSIFVNTGKQASWIEVKASTVAQCVGDKDKNNKLMFEHDIVNSLKPGALQGTYIITWHGGGWVLKRVKSPSEASHNLIPLCKTRPDLLEIIGTIHD